MLVFALAFTFGIWKWHSKTDTIEGGLSNTTEFLYWLAILTSSTLGASFGNLLAHDTPFDFAGGTLLLLSLLMVVVLLVFLITLARELLYWLAIILTHSIDATMGDYLTKPEGMNLGNIKASLVLILVFIVVIATGKLVLKKQPE